MTTSSQTGTAPPPSHSAGGGPVVAGTIAPGFEPVMERFREGLGDGGGAAFAAFQDGRPVVDLWGGWADRDQRRAWTEQTVVGVFSGSKGMVATCLLMLLERGRLELEAPVCEYWPEFAAAGKQEVLVRHVVSHTAGLPGLTTPVSCEEAGDDRRMTRLLAAQPCIHPPGTRLYYHALSFGWLCGELIRRVDGRSAGCFFAEEVAAPLALDAWIGLPAAEDHRVAVVARDAGFGSQGRDREAAAGDRLAWSIWANPPRFTADPLPANTRAWRAAEIPASSGVASARALARLYGCLARGGELDGVRLLSPASVALGARRLADGVEPYVGERFAFGVGFQLQTEVGRLGPSPDAFGHTGTGGSVHAAWPGLSVGASFVTNVLRESQGPDPRAEALLRALHEASAAPNSGAPNDLHL